MQTYDIGQKRSVTSLSLTPRSSVLLGLLTVQASKVHFKRTSTAATTVCISYSKSLVTTENATHFPSAKSSTSLHKRTTCGCRRISFLFCVCFQVKFQVQFRLSTVKTPIMSELEVYTIHLRKKHKLECGLMPNVMAALPTTCGALC